MPKFNVQFDSDTAELIFSIDGQQYDVDSVSIGQYPTCWPETEETDSPDTSTYVSYSIKNDDGLTVSESLSFDLKNGQVIRTILSDSFTKEVIAKHKMYSAAERLKQYFTRKK